MNLPVFALSIRQPWAWAIIHAGKPIENRSWAHNNPAHKDAKRLIGHRFAIHAAMGMTQDEYDHASGFITEVTGCGALPPHELVRGAIIGHVELVDIVRKSISPWFVGSIGLVMANPVPIEPIRATGQLGFFEWKPSHEPPIEPNNWMLRRAGLLPTRHLERKHIEKQEDLL